MARGVAVQRTGTGEYRETQTLDVGKVRFCVARPVFDAFEEGQTYRVYFVPHVPVPIMLSFERDLHAEEPLRLVHEAATSRRNNAGE
jgi:hypothetical protein